MFPSTDISGFKLIILIVHAQKNSMKKQYPQNRNVQQEIPFHLLTITYISQQL